ncbi:hypothetical protein ACJX0J_007981, partial [Zea mays]
YYKYFLNNEKNSVDIHEMLSFALYSNNNFFANSDPNIPAALVLFLLGHSLTEGPQKIYLLVISEYQYYKRKKMILVGIIDMLFLLASPIHMYYLHIVSSSTQIFDTFRIYLHFGRHLRPLTISTNIFIEFGQIHEVFNLYPTHAYCMSYVIMLPLVVDACKGRLQLYLLHAKCCCIKEQA